MCLRHGRVKETHKMASSKGSWKHSDLTRVEQAAAQALHTHTVANGRYLLEASGAQNVLAPTEDAHFLLF
jgi:hypothetical protein